MMEGRAPLATASIQQDSEFSFVSAGSSSEERCSLFSFVCDGSTSAKVKISTL